MQTLVSLAPAPAVKTPAPARNFYGNFIFKTGSRQKYFSVKAVFQSSHEAPRSSLRVLASN